ncbi:MAG TPA: peptidyl-prolyl cis-trans isomerase [Victivallales bacterium]|nr:peptidyl-prolyl cis-trans isomerase [Victivallales bacterium]
MKKFLLFFIFIFISVSIFAESENIGILATVNGEPVTLGDVLNITAAHEARLPLLYKGEELTKQLHKMRLKALNAIIDRKLVYMSFEEHGFTLPRVYVEENLDNLLEKFNVESRLELQKILNMEGRSYSEFKKRAYETAAVDALIYSNSYSNIFITPKQVFDYYREHKSEFTTPESLKLSIITLKTNGVHAQELKPLSKYLSKILKGKNSEAFKDAVTLYSDGPNLKQGGDIGWVPINELRKAFHSVLKEAKKGKVYGPIISKEAYYFIRIDDVKKKRIENYMDAKIEIRKKLTRKSQEKGYKEYIDGLKKKAVIKYYI